MGAAYFIVAIVVPTIFLASRGRLAGDWSFGGISWSVMAGVAGAMGALGIIIAMSNGGNAVYVMPLVFAGAPVLTVGISYFFARGGQPPSPMFYAGLILVIVGAVVVQVWRPASSDGHHQKPPVTESLGSTPEPPSKDSGTTSP